MKASASLALIAFLVSPLTALASQPCALSQQANLNLNYEGIRNARIEVANSTLRLDSSNTGQKLMTVRHCASNKERLEAAQVVVTRSGDTLLISAKASSNSYNWFGPSSYGYSEIGLTLPSNIKVDLDVGSGDANVRNIAVLTVDLGSGDVQVNDSGAVVADVGSGDLMMNNIASLKIDVGSGDAEARSVKADVRASVGSGDIVLSNIGSLSSAEVGSGDITAEGVRGDVAINSVGSGDATVKAVNGNVRIDDVGSGGIEVRGVDGALVIRSRSDVESVNYSQVKGKVSIGG
jgi:hypothetical protein